MGMHANAHLVLGFLIPTEELETMLNEDGDLVFPNGEELYPVSRMNCWDNEEDNEVIPIRVISAEYTPEKVDPVELLISSLDLQKAQKISDFLKYTECPSLNWYLVATYG